MASLTNPLSKFSQFMDNNDNNSYRYLKKITPEEAGLNQEAIKKLLSKLPNKKIKPHVDKKDVSEKKEKAPEKEQTIDNSGIRVLSYTEERNLFKKINELRLNQFMQRRREKIKEWYIDNRYSVNLLFKESMYQLIDDEVEFLVSNKELYNSFVEYCYDNYMKYHI